MLGEHHGETEADVSVIAVVFVVGLTVASAATLFFAVSDFGVPEPDYPPFEDETSPFAVDFVEGTLAGSPVETVLYDSTTVEEFEYGFDGSRKSPPSVDGGVSQKISSFQGRPLPPDSFADGKVRVPTGDYYVDSGSTVSWWSWSGGKVVFDTTDGPVRIAVADEGDVSAGDVRFEVEGSHPVEFYLDWSSEPLDLYVFDSTFENHRTDAVRIYGRSDGEYPTDVKFEDTEFRGVVYAPGTSVEFVDSTAHGASVAEETVLDNSSYYHDKHLERLRTDVLPGVDTNTFSGTEVLP